MKLDNHSTPHCLHKLVSLDDDSKVVCLLCNTIFPSLKVAFEDIDKHYPPEEDECDDSPLG